MTDGGTVSVTVRKPDTFNPIVTEYESCRQLYYLFYDGFSRFRILFCRSRTWPRATRPARTGRAEHLK